MRNWSYLALVSLAISLPRAERLSGQAAAAPADSADLVEEAEDRQREFERFRESRIPVAASTRQGGCDERIGRICIWFGGEGEEDFPPEPTETRNARVDLIRDLKFASVISGDNNDPPHYTPWTDKRRQEQHIDRFKLPLGSAGEKHDPLSLLIVKSMLLTGFDAPQAQVLYLDRLIQEAELLQAVARVNRTAPKKSHGLVVDYYGVSAQLTRALAAYSNTEGEIVDPDALVDQLSKILVSADDDDGVTQVGHPHRDRPDDIIGFEGLDLEGGDADRFGDPLAVLELDLQIVGR